MRAALQDFTAVLNRKDVSAVLMIAILVIHRELALPAILMLIIEFCLQKHQGAFSWMATMKSRIHLLEDCLSLEILLSLFSALSTVPSAFPIALALSAQSISL